MFSDLTDSLIVYSRGWTASEAMDAFVGGFNQLANAPVDPAQQQSIVNYYNDVFAKVEDAQTGHTVDIDALLPTSNAQRYLQAHYTAPFADPNAAIKNDDARDGSAWSVANARFNDFFREIVTRYGFEDALLIDPQGDIVYSAYKGVDLGSNILAGPYRGGLLADAYAKAMSSNDVDYVGITDVGDYQPADEPTAWMVSPIRTLDEGAFLGQTTLTREPVAASAYALGEVTVLQIDREHIEELVARKPLLLQDIGRAIEERRANVGQVLAAAQN
jgi:CRP-like cAMP-binding protein